MNRTFDAIKMLLLITEESGPLPVFFIMPTFHIDFKMSSLTSLSSLPKDSCSSSRERHSNTDAGHIHESVAVTGPQLDLPRCQILYKVY